MQPDSIQSDAMQSDFYHSSNAALADKGLFTQHRKVMDALQTKRREAIERTPHFEDMREAAHRLRLNALNRLPELLSQFEANAAANGCHVHWADTGDDANESIHTILTAHQAKSVIKGKSMISEETGLNHFLENRAYEVIESDLGELIVQVAGEHPSHIIAPAVHKRTAEIARLFHTKLGMTYSEDIPELIAFAREYMRDKYMTADVGISGVNFAVAETGSICLVENEGNGRFVTTAPKVHIAMMSLDKVVPKLADLPLLLELLCKSATGQAITNYVNVISGPRREGEKDGPQEVHIIILNNGRTDILQDTLLRETLKCIRCGACINNCPIYVNIGGHAYNAVIPGPIGKILMPQIFGMDRHGVLPTASSLCGACVEVCPVKIPITKILLKLRENAVNKRVAGAQTTSNIQERIGWKTWQLMHTNPKTYRVQRKLMGIFAFALSAKFPVLKNWMKYRGKPPITKQSLHDLVKQEGGYE